MLDPRLAALTWQADALCREHPTLAWLGHGEGTPPSAAERVELAAVCDGCLVRGQCDDFAEAIGARWGFYAGRWRRTQRR